MTRTHFFLPRELPSLDKLEFIKTPMSQRRVTELQKYLQLLETAKGDPRNFLGYELRMTLFTEELEPEVHERSAETSEEQGEENSVSLAGDDYLENYYDDRDEDDVSVDNGDGGYL